MASSQSQSRLATLPPIIASSFTCAAIMYPADLIKALRMGAPPHHSSLTLIGEFRRRFGLSGFFTQGVAPEVARAGLMRVIKFFCFPLTHEALWAKPASKGTPAEKAVAGALCTVPEALCIMPLEVAKVGLQLDQHNRFGGSSASVLRQSFDQAVPSDVVKNLSGYIRSDASLRKEWQSL